MDNTMLSQLEQEIEDMENAEDANLTSQKPVTTADGNKPEDAGKQETPIASGSSEQEFVLVPEDFKAADGQQTSQPQVNSEMQELRAEVQRLRSEAGRTKPLAEENKMMKDEKDSLLSQIETLKTQLASKSQKTDDDYLTGYSDEERDLVGDDTLVTMGKQKEQFVVEQQKTNASIAELKQQIAAMSERDSNSRKDAFVRQLEGIDGLSETVHTQGWKNFMHETDELSGLQYGEILKDAGNKCDVNKIGAVYNRFMQSNGVNHNQKVSRGFKPKSSSRGNQQNLSMQNQGTLSIDAYCNFLDNITKGRLNRDDKEVVAQMEQFEKAEREGRLV